VCEVQREASVMGVQGTCAKRRCRRPATQAFDVFSWFKPQRDQTRKHYEVCDKHAAYFTGTFNCDASKAVEKDLVEWSQAVVA
jgi:hypothetical protein